MTVVYADIMVLTSTVMLFAAYGTAALIHGIPAKVTRILIVSLILSIVSTIIILFFRFASNPVTAFALLVSGTWLCFGKIPIKKNLIYSLTALVCAILTGGVRLAVGSLPWILPVTLLYIAIFAAIKHIRAAVVKHQKLCHITVYRGEKSAELTALTDTGNELSCNGEKVIIAEKNAVADLFDNPDKDLRLIPYKSIGSEDGVLIGIRCDYALIDYVKKDTVIVAAVDTSLGSGVYNALINPETEVI